MNTLNSSRIELLHKDNYDTWKLQMKAEGRADQERSVKLRGRNSRETRIHRRKPSRSAELGQKRPEGDVGHILSISSSELKQLTLIKMADGSDVLTHLNDFFDAVDKLHDMDVILNQDQLTIMLLYNLPCRRFADVETSTLVNTENDHNERNEEASSESDDDAETQSSSTDNVFWDAVGQDPIKEEEGEQSSVDDENIHAVRPSAPARGPSRPQLVRTVRLSDESKFWLL
ncbi:hypothetical protein DMN91_006047 [Ooceraea biroi]|uniref:Uncharacterized protein n=1 Tax=Ooceraea biroi TaxID=2015173 RepID=A0A3L8DMR6_OOCBI|nr:hypothetical protein DMN91_006047 [Ooceraea biroi]